MADIVITGKDGVPYGAREGDLYLPYRGNWTAHLVLGDQPPAPPDGPVSLSWHGLALQGYVLRAGESEGTTSVLVVGGRGGLWHSLPAKYYDHQVALRLPLSEVIAAAGEVLASSSTPTILSSTLPSWPRRAAEPGQLLDELADVAGALWRVLPDGSIYFGADTWLAPQTAAGKPLVEDVDWTLLHTDPEWLIQEIAPLTTPAVLPGQAFGLGKVGRVHYQDDGELYTARIWYLDPSGQDDDGVVAGLRALVREEMHGTVWHPIAKGKVVQQRPNGTLDVVIDDRRIPPLTSVPVLVPVPGARLDVAAGARVQVAFTGGDPRYPVAMLFESGTGAKAIAITGDQADCGVLTIATVAPGAIGGTYVDPFGNSTTVAVGTPIPIKGKVIGSAPLKLP